MKASLTRFVTKTILTAMSFAFVQAQAQEFLSYDELIKQLKNSEVASEKISLHKPSGLEVIRFHAGVGLTSSRLMMKSDKFNINANISGVEAFVGVDLFSDQWIAEVAIKSYNNDSANKKNISLQEFEFRVLSEQALSSSFFWRAGAGLSARYLEYDQSYTTPAALFLLGLGSHLSPHFSIGLETSYKTSLIRETIDKQAFDGQIRLTGTF